MKLRAFFYNQFDADYSLGVPAEGFQGWRCADLEIDPRHTALVVMHAWDAGTIEQYPGWYRKAEFLIRAQEICREVFPSLLSTVRASPMQLFHVVLKGDHYRHFAGYKLAQRLAGPESEKFEQIASDPILENLRRFKDDLGAHNIEDIESGFKNLDFAKEARPQGEEGIAENARQLFALFKEFEINHLIYAGFAINWCLLLSPGGMAEMKKHGLMCSALRQAVTAVENKETARQQLGKENALWRVALNFGYVFNVDDLTRALTAN